MDAHDGKAQPSVVTSPSFNSISLDLEYLHLLFPKMTLVQSDSVSHNFLPLGEPQPFGSCDELRLRDS